MKLAPLKLVLVSTPIGHLGSGFGGGVELTISSLVKGLLDLGHEITLVAPAGSTLPSSCSAAKISYVIGKDQPSWQHRKIDAPVVIPSEGVLPRLWDEALHLGKSTDAVLNFSYDWLPIWLTCHVNVALFHLISMGAVSQVMQTLIRDLSEVAPSRLAFHTYRQANDYNLLEQPTVIGNGFDLACYELNLEAEGPLGWAGRIAPEKGLEDAVSVAVALQRKILVWGLKEDPEYAAAVESSAPLGTIEWRGFQPTLEFQRQLGQCSALLNTPKWNEAYGNVVIEALACGVPVVAYDRGGPGELIQSGVTGWLVPPDDVEAMIAATNRVCEINRRECRNWVLENASQETFASRVVEWVRAGLLVKDQMFNN